MCVRETLTKTTEPNNLEIAFDKKMKDNQTKTRRIERILFYYAYTLITYGLGIGSQMIDWLKWIPRNRLKKILIELIQVKKKNFNMPSDIHHREEPLSM